MIGTVSILNVSAGDTKLTFDPKMPAEVARAAKIVKDMLRRGFALLVEVGSDDKGPLYRRVHDFDEATTEYIIAGTPDDQDDNHEQKQASTPRARRQGKAAAKPRRIPAQTAKVVAVARTAGG